jgi:hypothetical protein
MIKSLLAILLVAGSVPAQALVPPQIMTEHLEGGWSQTDTCSHGKVWVLMREGRAFVESDWFGMWAFDENKLELNFIVKSTKPERLHTRPEHWGYKIDGAKILRDPSGKLYKFEAAGPLGNTTFTICR